MLQLERELKARGLTQAKLARKADVNESSMSRIVRGVEPAYSGRGQRIADALGWEGDWSALFEEVEADEDTTKTITLEDVEAVYKKLMEAPCGNSWSEVDGYSFSTDMGYAEDGYQIYHKFLLQLFGKDFTPACEVSHKENQ